MNTFTLTTKKSKHALEFSLCVCFSFFFFTYRMQIKICLESVVTTHQTNKTKQKPFTFILHLL